MEESRGDQHWRLAGKIEERREAGPPLRGDGEKIGHGRLWAVPLRFLDDLDAQIKDLAQHFDIVQLVPGHQQVMVGGDIVD